MSEAIKSLIEGLSHDQTVRLLTSITKITTEATKRYGCTPTLDEVAGLAQVRTMTLEGYSGDIENALFQLKAESPTLIAHLEASSKSGLDAVALGEGFAKTGIVSAEDITGLPPVLRERVFAGMTAVEISEIKDAGTKAEIGRALSLPISIRQGSNLSTSVQEFTDAKTDEFLSPAERMERHRKGVVS